MVNDQPALRGLVIDKAETCRDFNLFTVPRIGERIKTAVNSHVAEHTDMLFVHGAFKIFLSRKNVEIFFP